MTAMKVVLTEKPSVARDIAAFLGATARHEGWLEGAGYQVTWALGHLVELQEPQDYDPALKRWSLASLPFVPERFQLKVIDDAGARKQFGIVKRLFKGATELICATDAGREGELIFRFILEMAGGTKRPVRRLWLSSLTEDAIRDAFRRLKPAADYERLHAAARCRAESDWIVGLNATRFYTVQGGSSGLLWSVGRVQTPVLAMIVARDDEIRTFKPEPYWELKTKYRETVFDHVGDRFKKSEDADAVLARVRGQPFTVDTVERKPERLPPPQLFDLTELQREMNRRHGFSAAATLKIAQALYEAKMITYPRTDSRHIGNDMKAPVADTLRKLAPRWQQIAKLNLAALPFNGRIVDDAKVTDHHAILPSGKAPGALGPQEQKVYDAVVLRLIAAFYPACEKEVTSVHGRASDVPFKARGVRIVKPGWTELYPRKAAPAKPEEQELPAFTPREAGPHEPFVKQGETTPPKAFTESTLLSAMETAGRRVTDEALKEALKARGLGTPATRAAIIETLLKRSYIARDQKALVATDLGRYLIARVHDRALKSPEMTGEWESRLREIEAGRLERLRFMQDIGRYIGELIRSGGRPQIDPARLGECPRCAKPVIEGKRAFGCSGWRDGCRFVLPREHEGLELSPAQVRELLQCRVTLEPVTLPGASGPQVLRLTDTGVVTPVPVPAARPPPQRAPAAAERAPRPAKKPRGFAERGDARRPKPEREPKAPAGPPGKIGTCPLCNSDVVDRPKSYGCSGWAAGCQFAIWKTIAGKKITEKMAKALLGKGKSPRIKGFKSKAGKAFEAQLKLEGGQVVFDFQQEG
jgi:DNA topoisomerase-3